MDPIVDALTDQHSWNRNALMKRRRYLTHLLVNATLDPATRAEYERHVDELAEQINPQVKGLKSAALQTEIGAQNEMLDAYQAWRER